GRAVEEPALEVEASLVLRIDAGEHVEERGLAGGLGADEGVDLARVDREAHVGERGEPAEMLRDVLDGEDGRGRRAHSRTVNSRLRTAEGSSPAGRTSIITTIASPKSSMRMTSGSMIERPKIQR